MKLSSILRGLIPPTAKKVRCCGVFTVRGATRTGGIVLFGMGGATLHMCPYEGCDGDVFMDAWPWEKLVRMNGYPEDPEFGKRYPMYS